MASGGDGLSALKRALLTIERLERDLRDERSRGREPLAIVGMACRFPSAPSPRELWALLERGGDAVREVPPERWDVERYFDRDPDAVGKTNSRRAGLLEHLDRLDPAFFGISVEEAETLDPQQRWTLEVAWEAFEDAGRTRDELAGSRTSVIWGAFNAEHMKLAMNDSHAITTYTGTGSALNLISGRVAYVFDLVGPNLTIDTACSSSLMAVHLAAASLRRGECDLALAGGVNAILTPDGMIAGSKMRMLAPDGRCKVFDARADGFVRGEGCGAVVLCRLSDALERGDRIHAVLRGSATNQDGRSNGLTAPNVLAQVAVIEAALADAGVERDRVGYVEAHGTGTALGDPVEVEALRRVFRDRSGRAAPLRLGAIKANLGHLESAAGIAGLIKAVLVLAHGRIPPQIHFERPNPHAPLDDPLFQVRRQGSPWPREGARRVAGVSSFGWSGSNVHAVVEEAPDAATDARDAPGPWLVPLSAHSERSLRQAAAHLAKGCDDPEAPSLARVARTRALRRSHLEHRLAVVADDRESLVHALRGGVGVAGGRATARPRVAFVFPGQGSQWAGMGRELARRSPAAREALDEVDAVVRGIAGWSLLDELARGEGALERVDRIQPAVFALQLALARFWQGLGVAPAAVVGHSMGELAAAQVAGALSVEDAALAVCERSRIVAERAPPGGMLVVQLAAAEAAAALEEVGGAAAVAAENGPRTCIVSGPEEALAALEARLEARDVSHRRVRVDYASHGPGMDPLLEPLRQRLGGLSGAPTAVPFWSTVRGERVDGPELGAEYWVHNLRSPVRFWPAVDALVSGDVDVLLEISPNEVVAVQLEASLAEAGRDGVAVVPSVRRNTGEWRSLLEAVGRLYGAGADLRWTQLHDARGPLAELPPYAWDRQRYVRSHGRRDRTLDHALLRRRVDAPSLDAVLFEGEIDPAAHEYVTQHRVFGVAIAPGVLFVELALEAAHRELGSGVELFDVAFEAPLRVGSEERIELQVALRPGESEVWRFDVHAREAGGPWQRHASGSLRLVSGERIAAAPPEPAHEAPARLYERLEAAGLEYGPLFRGLEACGLANDGASGAIAPPERLRRELGAYRFHPALLDACLHPLGLLVEDDGEVFLPVGVDRVQVLERPAGAVRSHVRVARAGFLSFDIEVFDGAGSLLARLSSLAVQRTTRVALERATRAVFQRWQYATEWDAYRPAPPVADASRRWLVLGGARGVGGSLAAALERARHHAVSVHAGPGSEPGDALETRAAGAFDGVILLAGLDARAERTSLESIEAAVGPGCESVRRVLSRLAEAGGRPPALWVATSNAWCVGEDDAPVAPEQASLVGLLRSARNELPDLHPRALDLPASPTPGDLEAAVLCLHDREPEDEVAIRREAAWRPRLRPVTRAASAPVRVVDDGGYLVTGGFGGIGRVVARWLADRGARRLALVGRRGAAAPDARALVAELEAAGCQVLALAADLSNAAEAERVVAAAGPLRGIVHCAAVLDDGVLIQQGPREVSRVFGPKALGAWHLHALTRDEPLDFFALFSSAAAVLGSPGQSGYAAANAFLDALAMHRRQLGLPATSIQWGAWAETGLAAARGDPLRSRLDAAGVGWLMPDEAVAILESRLASEPGVVAVMPMQWEKYVATLGRVPSLLSERAGESARTAAASDAALRRELEAMPEPARLQAARAYLERAVADLVGLADADEIGGRDGLFDLGLDSLRLLELRARISGGLGIGLPIAAVFRDPSISGLSHLVCRSVGGAPAREGEPTDFIADAALEPGIAPAAPERTDHEGAVLLTGATGFVGAHLLRALLERSEAEVCCLVRADDEDRALDRLRRSQAALGLGALPADRVRVCCGDLAEPDLGLPDAAYDELAERAGSVYHCGAIVNFSYPYGALRAANVGGTEAVLRLAVRRRTKRIHFVSSIAALDGHVADAIVHEIADPRARDFKTGYAQSKWVAERLVLEAGARGLPISVYRLAEVGPAAKQGIWNPNDFTFRLLQACLEVGAFPDLDFALSLVPVDAAAAGVVALAAHSRAAPAVFHLVSPETMRFQAVVSGAGLDPLPYARWRSAVANAPAGHALAAILPATAEEFAGRVRLPALACDATRRALAERGLAWPPDAARVDEILPSVSGSPKPAA